VLDLFAGTGACGIEALSRGASHATFVDRSAGAIKTVAANLDRTGLAERASIIRADALRFLSRSRCRFDLCLLDPPYAAGPEHLGAALSSLNEGRVGPGFTVALTRRLRSSMPVIPVNWRVARRLEYGDTLVVLYREA
jgi:16S rRNA (guanine966-N2)-methyltransferase